MKKKYASMFIGLMMAVVITFPAMATEASTDVSGVNTSDISEIAVLTSEISDEDDVEDAAIPGNVSGEDDITAVAGGVEDADTDIYAGDSEIITADTYEEDFEEITTDTSAANDGEISEYASGEDSTSVESQDQEEEQSPDEDLPDDDSEDAENPIATLSAEAVPVTGVTLDKTKLTINSKDQTPQLTATVSPEDATDPSVAWKSSDTKVVTVDKDGKLTAVKDGKATITVTTTDGEYTADCTVTVSLYSDGFHQDPDGTDWCWYKDGKISTGTTDIIQGTVNGKNGYWNVVKGIVSTSATVAKGTVDGTTAWWYVNNKGMVDTSYTGFATNSSGSWYAESGKVTKKTNGVIKDDKGALGSSSAWYYVLNSKVQYDFTGLADYSNASGWWYITNGKVDRSVTTVAKNKNGWWYVANGKVNKSYTGFGTNSSGSWYVEKGKVTKKVNGVFKDSTGALGSSSNWYYVLNSKVQTGFTGLADYSNASGWWYITNGKVDRSYTGLAKNKNGWWYITNGKVDRSYTGTAQNSNGWWYVEKGKVDTSAVALVKTDGGWQAYTHGKLDTSYTGMAINESGWWYVDDGTLIRDDCLTDAARYVGSLTSTSQSAEEKLRTVYDYMRSNYNYIRSYDGKPGTEDMASYAVDFFKDKGGNCYRYAIAATCIVKVLGYDTRTVLGNVSTSDGSGMTRHGWCELYINGDWYILDVNFGVYIKKADQHPRKLEAEDTYVLNIEDGKAVWE